MRVIIVLGGDDSFSLYRRKEEDYIIGVDGGIKAIKNAKAELALAIGDFDTIDIKEVEDSTSNIIKLDPNKDASDFDFALEEARKLSPESIIVYNYEGGRLDHYEAILNTIIRNSDLNIFLVSLNNVIKVVKGNTLVNKMRFKYISFFAIEDNTNISLKGFKYPLESKIINRFDNLCLSNEIEDKGYVTVDKKVLMIMSNDR